MPHLNHTGPEGEGPKSGRKLGKCRKKEEETIQYQLGQGMGKSRKSSGDSGKGKRLKSSKLFNNEKNEDSYTNKEQSH